MRLPLRITRRSFVTWCAGAVTALLAVWLCGVGMSVTTRTSFCLACHEMKAAGKELAASGHATNRSGTTTQCADCHIAPGLAGLVKAKWEGLDELSVHLFNTSRLAEPQWTSRREKLKEKLAAEMPQECCTKCHDLANMRASTREAEVAHKTITPAMRCLDCHSVRGLRRLVHTR